MAEETKRTPTYRPGDSIRIVLDVSDESGVSEVHANFTLRGDRRGEVDLYGDGAGKTQTTVVLETRINELMVPGEYYCFSITLDDLKGNRRFVSSPGLEFRIEGILGDREGPLLRYWIFPRDGLTEELAHKAIEALVEEWKEQGGQIDSKNVYQRLLHKVPEVPRGTMELVLEDLKVQGLIKGRGYHDREGIPRHGAMKIGYVDERLL